MRIEAFDFDGTLTDRDTLLEFIRYTNGNASFVLGFLLFSPLLILMKIHLYPNWKVKQRIFSYFYRGCSIVDFNRYCIDFAADKKYLLRKEGMSTVQKAIKEGAKVLIVSASIDNWVKPFFEGLEVTVLGTKIDIKDGLITGRFLTKNCYGIEKVNRINAVCQPRADYTLLAYGDSCGDKEMLEYADKGYYKPFRKKDNNNIHEIKRFLIVGGIATIIQFTVYRLFLYILNPTLANTVGYLVSFMFNFYASTKYTFNVETNTKHGLGFAFSHLINYLMQTGLLNLFIWIGVSKNWAQIPMFCICVPTNFVLVRFFLKR